MMPDGPVDHDLWGRRIVHVRSLDNFSAYGADAGYTELVKGWNHFTFSGDARQLALTPRNIEAKCEETYTHSLDGSLKVPNLMYNDPVRVIKPRERNAWFAAFIEAYTDGLEEKVSELIPAQIREKLGIFCGVVTAIQYDAEHGHDTRDFGVELGKKQPVERKLRPKKDQIVKRARHDGYSEAEMHWSWQVNGDTPIRRPWYVHAPYNWEVSPEDEDLYVRTYEAEYLKTLKERVRAFAPPKAWKNAYLICSLYDEMENQRLRGRRPEYAKGWTYLRSQRDHDLLMTERRQKEEREVFEKRYAPKAPSLGAHGDQLFFSRGVRMTPGAREAFVEAGEQPMKYLERHFSGDFGRSNHTSDREMNLSNAKRGSMVMSIYELSTGTEFYVITDDGHEVSTFLLPEEY